METENDLEITRWAVEKEKQICKQWEVPLQREPGESIIILVS